jgi:cob(I)alamin adenosyltransferase|tara:strand:- start:3639 stop:3929 length:291 start_codon:yes stop_codon:yes gene_type:complete
MTSWLLPGILSSVVLALLYLCWNFSETLKNIQTRLYDLQAEISEFEDLVQRINGNETYYGDPIIQAFVDATDQLKTALEDVTRIQEEIRGDGEKTN